MKVPIFLLLLAAVSLPATAQDFALKQLEESPRHHEWVEIRSGSKVIHAFVAHPEVQENAPTVIVLHENRGLTDWVRSFADQLAAEGYVAIAPDLLSNANEAYEKTNDYPSSDAAREAIYALDQNRLIRDLMAVQRYALRLPSSNRKVALMGFCWGGSQTFNFATHAVGLSAAMVFYGSPPENKVMMGGIEMPVYGFYGENDQRINATIPETERIMKETGRTYEYEVYPDAGHAFMRRGDDPNGDPANKAARDAAWDRLLGILAAM